MFQLRRISILLAWALTAAPSAWAELQATGEPPAAKQGWKAETVAQGVRQPWGIAWLGEGRALVTSKQGTLHLLNGKSFEDVALDVTGNDETLLATDAAPFLAPFVHIDPEATATALFWAIQHKQLDDLTAVTVSDGLLHALRLIASARRRRRSSVMR